MYAADVSPAPAGPAGPATPTPLVPILLAALPLLLLVVMCVRLHVDVPFGDQWELVPRLDHMDAGRLTFDDVWRQHNEHRPMVPILIMLGLAWLTSWNISAEIAVNVLIGLSIFAVFAVAFRRLNAGAGWRWWGLPIVAFLVASPVQWENWLWGWQIQVLLGVFIDVLGFWWLARPDRTGRRFAGALACGVIGTYSFASGLTYWLVGCVPLLLVENGRKPLRVAIWTIVAAATIASYFFHYAMPAGHPPLMANFSSLAAVVQLVTYLLKYLGGLIGYTVLGSTLSLCAGALGLVAFLTLVARNWTAWRDAAFMFPCTIGLNTIADAGMTSIGRTGFGTDQALASRYTTIAEPLWTAIVLLVVLDLARRGGFAAASAKTKGLLAAATAALVLCASAAALVGTHAAAERMTSLRVLRSFLHDGVNWTTVAELYAPIRDVATVKQRAATLRMLGMSVYRD